MTDTEQSRTRSEDDGPATPQPPPARGRGSRQAARLGVIAVALAILLGVGFRFYDLGGKLIWHDEVSTRILAGGHLHAEWKEVLYSGRVFPVADVQRYQHDDPERSLRETVIGLALDDPQHPPLYYLLAHLWMGVAGDGIGALRALSALLSLLCFPAIFWLSRELFRSTRIAWTSVALAAVSPLLVLYAQEAREYALWTALLLLSTAALLRAIRLTEDAAPTRALVQAWGWYGLASLLSLYTSFSTVSVLAAQVLFLIVRERARLTRVAKAGAVTLAGTALLFLPWVLNLLHHYDAFAISMKWSREIVLPTATLLRILAVNASRITLDLWREPHHLVAWLMVAITLVVMVWALVALARRGPKNAALLLGALVVVPIGLLLGPDLVLGGIRSVSARYLIPSWAAVLVALAFLPFGERRSRWEARLAPVALGAVLLVSIASCIGNARQAAVWTKGISYDLPVVADHINRAPRPLVIGNMEQYHPGNLMALSNLLAPRVRMQFLRPEMEAEYRLPPEPGDVFLISPTIQFRRGLERREHVRTRLVFEDIYLKLWAVDPEE